MWSGHSFSSTYTYKNQLARKESIFSELNAVQIVQAYDKILSFKIL
jgi:hypothetical protein